MEQILQLPLDEVRRSEWRIVCVRARARARVCACVCVCVHGSMPNQRCRHTHIRAPQVVLLARDFLAAVGDDGFLDHDSFADIAQRRLGITKRQVARTYSMLDRY